MIPTLRGMRFEHSENISKAIRNAGTVEVHRSPVPEVPRDPMDEPAVKRLYGHAAHPSLVSRQGEAFPEDVGHLGLATAAVLASQAAKNEFNADLRTFWRELDAADECVRDLKATVRPVIRRRPRERREPLPVESARAVPILALFERYGHELRRVGGEWVTRCPFHEDRRPSLSIRPDRGVWFCHPCGVGGDGLAFVMRLKGFDFVEAVREVAA